MEQVSGRRVAVYIHASDIQTTVESGKAPGNKPSNGPGSPRRIDGGIIEEETDVETAVGNANTTPKLDVSSTKPTPSLERQTRSASPFKQDEDKMAGNKRTRRGSINLQVG